MTRFDDDKQDDDDTPETGKGIMEPPDSGDKKVGTPKL